VDVYQSLSEEDFDKKKMPETCAALGSWLASDSANLIGDKETMSIYIVNPRAVKEVIDIVTPLSRRLKNGVVVWGKGIYGDMTAQSTPKIQFKKLEIGSWDLVVHSPIALEILSNAVIAGDVLHSLTKLNNNENSRLIICVAASAETNPVAVRVRV
jgi:hypothetical protein